MGDLDINGALGSVLPYLSYLINMMSKLFVLLASYLGIDLNTPSEEETSSTTEAA